MWQLIKKIGKRALAAVGVLVILMAIGLGGFRLLASRLPSYQQDIQAWVQAELGLSLRFQRIDLRMSLRGPEVTFYDVAIASDDPSEPFVLASQAAVTLDGVTLIAQRQFAARRLVLEGIRLTVIRSEDGVLQIGGAPDYAMAGQNFDFELPRQVELVVRQSDVLYEDRMLDVLWQFHDVTVSVDQTPDAVSMSVVTTPPASIGSRIEMNIDGVLDESVGLTDAWTAFITVRDANLDVLSRLWPVEYVSGLSGNGDVSAWVDISGGIANRIMLDLALEDVALSRLDGRQADRFDKVSLTAEWLRETDAWQLTLDEVLLSRDGQQWRRGGNSMLRSTLDGKEIELHSDFLRLHDLTPIVRRLPSNAWRDRWLALDPKGELRDLVFNLDRSGDVALLEIAAEFADVGVEAQPGMPGFQGLTGEVKSDGRSGTLSLASTSSSLRWPAHIPEPLSISGLSGVLIWREGRSGVRVVTDELDFNLLGADVSTSFELTMPTDGASPRLDLVSQIGAFDVLALKRYMPKELMPDSVSEWLDSAISAGLVQDANLSFYGALDAFPFDNGDGQFHAVARVMGGRLDYIDQWPPAEDIDGTIEIINSRFRGYGSGRIFGNVSDTIDVTIEDMRVPVLELAADTSGPLSDVLRYLTEAPLISRYLGPSYELLSAPRGTGKVSFDLSLPLPASDAYELEASLAIADGELSVEGFPPHAMDLEGLLVLRDNLVTSESIQGTFLDGPFVATVSAPERPGYRARLDVDGEVTAEAVLAAFSLPYQGLLAGQTLWNGNLYLPSHDRVPEEPILITVGSNLSGVALKFPEPFVKPPGDPTSLHFELAFMESGRLDVLGNLGAANRFRAAFARSDGVFRFERGAVTFGGAEPSLPVREGIALSGNLSLLDISEWMAMSDETEIASPLGNLASVNVNVSDLKVFKQELGATQIRIEPVADDFAIDIDSEAVAGHIDLPRVLKDRPLIRAQLSHLQLQPSRATGLGTVDPRRLPGLSIAIEDFAVGMRRFGSFNALLQADPMGLRLVSFDSATENYSANGSGAWLSGEEGGETRLAFNLSTENVAGTLDELGYEPLIEGSGADLTASVHWPGGPSPDWMTHVSGDIGLHVEEGSLLDIDPGAGRVIGLMSIVALPRRLALDFRDVFNKGFAFDEISGDFVIVDGDAYTDNLKLSGPAAEIGIVGRTGLRDHDFHQQAVVTAEPSNMLPTVGGLIAGPGVAAALLIFTRIFKEPLKGIGRAAYCITGNWDAPVVDRLTAEQIGNAELCAELPPGAQSLANILDEPR